MKKNIFLLILSIIFIGIAGYTLSYRENKTASENLGKDALPSPYKAAEETLFITNVPEGSIIGWTLHDETGSIIVTKKESSSQKNPWSFTYQKGIHGTYGPFPAAESEARANARNFLSLAYLHEDENDDSLLKALSMQKNAAASLTKTPFYELHWHKKRNTEQASLETSSAETLLFIEGEAAPPLRKLYFQGNAYWVREWYLLALAREPEGIYPKDILELSLHQLETIKQSSLDDPSGFSLMRTEPYTWTLVPAAPSEASPSRLRETIETFIETLIFLKAERALILHSKEELDRLKAAALKTIFLTFTTRVTADAAPEESRLVLYIHEESSYAAASSHPGILYMLPAKKSIGTLLYSYDSFYR